MNILCNILIAMVVLLPSVAYGEVVEASIDSVQMVVGEQTGYRLSATVRPGQKVAFPRWVPQQMVVPGLEVVETPRIDTVDAKDGFIKVTQHLILTAFEDTLYYIPKQVVRVDNKPFETRNLALKVLTVEVDTLHPNQFFGPRDVQDNPFLWEEWARLLWISLGVVLLYVLCWLAYIRLKSDKPIRLKVKIVKRIPPHQKALTNIQRLKDEGMAETVNGESDAKAYYTQLTDTLRTYMEARFGFNAMEMTSSEIIARLRQEGDQEKIQELTTLFETADLVKFAKYNVGMNENDRNLVSAIDFINNTKRDNEPTEERIEPTVTEQERHTIRMRRMLKWGLVLMVIIASAMTAYLCWQLYDLRW